MAKMLELKLKLYHLGEAKTISCKKTDTLDQLIGMAVQAHGIEGKTVEEIRLR